MKSIKKKIGFSFIAVLLVIGIITSIVLLGPKQAKAGYDGVMDNGETPVVLTDKVPILDRIMYENGKLVVLEIVPYKYAGIFDMLLGTGKVRERLEADAKNLFNEFSYRKTKDSEFSESTLIGGDAGKFAYGHGFKITHNLLTDEYSVEYPNFFIEQFLDGFENPKALPYFSNPEHIEVRTVVAGELKESDLKDVSLIYCSSKLENDNVAYFNAYIDGKIDAKAANNATSDVCNKVLLDTFKQDGNAYNLTEANQIWYDSYHKEGGNLVGNDLKWNMVTYLIEYIFGEHRSDDDKNYTDGQPIPCLVNIGSEASSTYNIGKFDKLLFKTSALGKDADGNFTVKYSVSANGITQSTYYRDVLDNIVEKPVSAENASKPGIAPTTGYYVYNGTEYDFNRTDIPILYEKTTQASEYMSNHVFKNINNGSASFLSIGNSQINGVLQDGSGTLGVREVVKEGDSYTVSTALKYLMGVYLNNTKPIRVLEIEPCQDYMYQISENASAAEKEEVASNIFDLARALRIKAYTKVADATPKGSLWSAYEGVVAGGKKIEFTCMTTLKFNGMMEDLLGNYDIIVIGEKTGMLNTDSTDVAHIADINGNDFKYKTIYKNDKLTMPDGATIYNDKALDGYVYLAFGDLFKVKQGLLGYLPDEYTALSSVPGTFSKYDMLSNGSYKKPGTTGLDKNKLNIFDIHIKELWTPLVYNELTKKSNNKFYVTTNMYGYDNGDNGLFYGWNIWSMWSGKDTESPWTGYSDWRVGAGYYLYYDYKDRPSSIGNVRGSANDITETKMNQLKEFIEMGNPVVMSDNVYNCTNKDLYNKQGGIVYPTSYLYKLVGAEVNNKHTVKLSNIYADLLDAINTSFLAITDCKVGYGPVLDSVNKPVGTECPVIAYDGNGLVTESSIITQPGKLNYSVTFTCNPKSSYMVSLYFDKNTNGRFNEVLTTDDDNEVFYTAKVTPGVNGTTTYNFSVPIALNFNGMFTWRAQVKEITSTGAELDRDVFDGYTIIRGEKKQLRVLQILPANSNITLDMTKTVVAGTNDFPAALKSAQDMINYDITIETIDSDQFESIYANNGGYVYHDDYRTAKDFLKTGGVFDFGEYEGDYSMVVIGFADMYGQQDISNDYGALSNILDFGEKGNSILFTHDTIANSNNVNYGLKINADGTLVSGSKNDEQAYGYKMSVDFSRLFRDLVGMDKYSVSTITNRAENDKIPMYAEGDSRRSLYGGYIREIQGINPWNIHLYSLSGSNIGVVNGERTAKEWIKLIGQTRNAFSYASDSNGLMVTTNASEVNKGQISVYPYSTTDSEGYIKIATTHGQYFELKLDDPDLVVWYALDGRDSADDLYYKDNKGDAANNYYIYSKNNITYSGAGHSGMDQPNEHKLFVNTIIKAATAGNYIPEITVTNGTKGAPENGTDRYFIYASNINDYAQVDFVAKDDDLATREVVQQMHPSDYRNYIGRFHHGYVYWEDLDTGEKKVLIEYKYQSGDIGAMKNILLNGEKNTFYLCDPYTNDKNAGTVEYAGAEGKANMKACYDVYEAKGTVQLYFEAIDSKGAIGTAKAKVTNHDLFDLD